MSELRETWATTVYQWQEARTTVANAFSAYVDLCSRLSNFPQEASGPTRDLASQISSTLGPANGSLHGILANQLAQSQVMLARTRNRLMSPIYSCPEEILSKIFLCYVYDRNFNDTQSGHSPGPHEIGSSIRTFYYRIHTVLGVSFVWRGIGLSMPMLWNLIPVIKTDRPFWSKQATGLSLSRSGTLPLELAVKNPQILTYNHLVKTLTEHAPRFRTINIISEQPRDIRDIMNPLLEHNVVASLSDLSLCTSDLKYIRRLANSNEACYVFLPESPQNDLLLSLLTSLTRLRLYGSTMAWDQIAFSTRLVDLQLNSVLLISDSHLHDFLKAISTASRLQQLALISITSYPQQNLGEPPEVSLPNLQSLVLEDLYFNTLSIIIRSVTSRAHQSVLYLTAKSTKRPLSTRDREFEQIGFPALCDLLQTHAILVTTLLLSNEQSLWFKAPEIANLLAALPSLETLKLHHWTIDKRFCRAIMCREEPQIGFKIPCIHDLHLIRASLADQESLKSLVLNHGVRAMILDGKLNHGSEESQHWQFLNRSDDIIGWLAANVLDFKYVDLAYDPPEFRSNIWQLW